MSLTITANDIKALMPVSIGLELETARDVAYNLVVTDIVSPLLSMDMHPESDYITELNLKPAYTKSIVEVALSGELIRRCNPVYWRGEYDLLAGSAHCHVVPPPIENIRKESNKCRSPQRIKTEGLAIPLRTDKLEQVQTAHLLWSPRVQSFMLPFMSMGYLKGTQYTFRDKLGLLSTECTSWDRGTGMMLNTYVPYGGYGLEFRVNENTPLWVYLLPYVVLLVNRNKLTYSVYHKADTLTYYRKEPRGDSDFIRDNFSAKIKGILDYLRPHLLSGLPLMSEQVREEERPFFIELMTAYIQEDTVEYTKLIKGLTDSCPKTRILFSKIDDTVSDILYNTDAISGQDLGFGDKYTTAVHGETR